MYKVILYTNRNIMVWNAEGKQDVDLQSAVDCYGIDYEILPKLFDTDCEYYIAKWNQWTHQISKKEFQYLLGIRTLEMDLDDFEKE